MLSFVGGSRVGWLNASFPLARFHVSENELVLNTLGREIRFAPEDVVRVERVTWLPVLASGVRIVHTRSDVSEQVIFWHLRSPNRILSAVAETGFVAGASAREVPARRFPFRIPFLVAAALVWNALLGWDMFVLERQAPGAYTMVALALACAVSVGILLPTPMRTIALHRSEDVGRVSHYCALVAAIAAVMLVFMALQ